MDYNMKQWRNEEQNELSQENNCAKLPRLVLDLDSSSSYYSRSVTDCDSYAIPLFVSEPTKLSAYNTVSADSTLTATKFPRMGSSYFSLDQWQELELQALIYRHMLAGAPVPHELLHLVKKSLINSTPYYNLPQHFQQYHHYQQALLQTGYWGRTNMDPEPGRCRRTDGKKWRCSRDVVSGHKYCERHVHRGRNRSRKPVDITTTAAPRGGDTASMADGNTTMADHGSTPQFALSGPAAASIDLLHLKRRPSESVIEKKGPMEAQNDVSKDGKSSGQILRHFFDDWPTQQLQESENATSY